MKQVLTKLITSLITNSCVQQLKIYSAIKVLGTDNATSTDNVFSCFKITNIPTFDRITQNYSDVLYEKDGIFVARDSNKIITFVKNMYKIETVSSIIRDTFGEYKSIKSALRSITKEIRSFRPRMMDITQTLESYPTYIDGNSINIYTELIPEKVHDRGTISPLTKTVSEPITKIEFQLGDDCQLLSVKLNKPHPNANSKNFLCLGSFKYRKINDFLISEILNRIKTINLDDCYWTPEELGGINAVKFS